uniref:Uncharacterized protein n=1 Tax=Oryza glaberrima TaxID=4538 RepID=I1PDL3_ORYGL
AEPIIYNEIASLPIQAKSATFGHLDPLVTLSFLATPPLDLSHSTLRSQRWGALEAHEGSDSSWELLRFSGVPLYILPGAPDIRHIILHISQKFFNKTNGQTCAKKSTVSNISKRREYLIVEELETAEINLKPNHANGGGIWGWWGGATTQYRHEDLNLEPNHNPAAGGRSGMKELATSPLCSKGEGGMRDQVFVGWGASKSWTRTGSVGRMRMQILTQYAHPKSLEDGYLCFNGQE